MTERYEFPPRREAETHSVSARVDETYMTFLVTFGFKPDGRIGEIFIEQPKSSKAPLFRDIAKILSHCIQRNTTIDDLVAAVERGSDDKTPMTVIGAVLDKAKEVENGNAIS